MGTLIYTYTGQSNTNAERTVQFGQFAVSGDTNKYISKITKIVYTHWHTSTPARYWELIGRLNFSDGTSIVSDSQYLNTAGGIKQFTNTFSASLTAEQWNKLVSVQTLDNRGSAGPTYAYWNSNLYWRADESYPMAITVEFDETIPVVYNPQILNFKVNRKGALSEYATATMHLAIGNSAGLSSAKLYLYYAANRDPDITIDPATDLSEYIDDALSGSITLDLAGEFGIEDSHCFTLVFAAGQESFPQDDSFGRAKGSLHISGYPGGGICVGGFSKGTTTAPRFETYAPAYFYGGIADFGGTSLRDLVGVQAGQTESQRIGSGYTGEYNIIFPKAYASPPVVVANLAGDLTGSSTGHLGLVIAGVTASGCTIRVGNSSGAAYEPAVAWMAFGTI